VTVSATTTWQTRSSGFGGERGECDGGLQARGAIELDTSVYGTEAKRQNSRRVTAAVMRYGYRRGEFFEGCEPRCGKGRPFPIGYRLRSVKGGGTTQKRSELHPVSGCNKPVACARSKPSRWCETTRTERVDRLAANDRTMAAMSSGSGRAEDMSEEGHHTQEDESQERRTDPGNLRRADVSPVCLLAL